MRLYKEYKKSSISMHDDKSLIDLLTKLVLGRVQVIIETGTYLGTGSTTFLANLFAESKSLEKLYTCEISYRNYRRAKKNLKRFSFVECLFGNSVKNKEAFDFIKHDQLISDHKKYGDIFIDDISNPTNFYLNELRGNLGQKSLFNLVQMATKKICGSEDILSKLIDANRNKQIMFNLDSAGGIGYLEFKTVKEKMRERNYYLMLDDVYHIKHFRSREEIEKDPSFKIIGVSKEYGWLLARHKTN